MMNDPVHSARRLGGEKVGEKRPTPRIAPVHSGLLDSLLFPWRHARIIFIATTLFLAISFSWRSSSHHHLHKVVTWGALLLGAAFGYSIQVCRHAGMGRLGAPGWQDVTNVFDALYDLARALLLTAALMLPSIGAFLFLDIPADQMKLAVCVNVGVTIFLWPMGFLILALVPAGYDFLKPWLLLPAIGRALGAYLKIVSLTLGLLYALDMVLGIYVYRSGETSIQEVFEGMGTAMLAWGLHFYVLLVFAHAMGRFYRENEEHLGWFTREALRGE